MRRFAAAMIEGSLVSTNTSDLDDRRGSSFLWPVAHKLDMQDLEWRF
jgi:hypothetical protein